MTPEYHLVCAGAELPRFNKPPRPTAFADLADKVQAQAHVRQPTVVELVDAAIAVTQEPATKALLTQARGLLA